MDVDIYTNVDVNVSIEVHGEEGVDTETILEGTLSVLWHYN